MPTYHVCRSSRPSCKRLALSIHFRFNLALARAEDGVAEKGLVVRIVANFERSNGCERLARYNARSRPDDLGTASSIAQEVFAFCTIAQEVFAFCKRVSQNRIAMQADVIHTFSRRFAINMLRRRIFKSCAFASENSVV